jgi:hypothetical protein
MRRNEPLDSPDHPRSGLAAIAQIAHQPGIAHCQPTELGWGHSRLAQEAINFNQQ